jgi:hypothetical protein
MRGDPVIGISAIEISARAMSEDVQEEAAIGLQSREHECHQFAPAHDEPPRAARARRCDTVMKIPGWTSGVSKIRSMSKPRLRNRFHFDRLNRGFPSFFLQPAMPYWLPSAAFRNG